MMMDFVQENIAIIEDLLVKEFRTCQNLKSLIDNEREAMFNGGVERIMEIVEQKETLLDELEHLEEKRRAIVPDLADCLGLSTREGNILEIIHALDPENAGRLNRLREGILALVANIRDLTHGNRALAISALQRADALQAFLLHLFEPYKHYQPPGIAHSRETTVSWDIDHKV